MTDQLRTGPFTARSRQEIEPPPATRLIVSIPVTALTTTATVLFTAPTTAFLQINDILVCNYSGGVESFTIYEVPSGGSAGTSNVLYSAISINAGETSVLTKRWAIVMEPGASLQALASTDATCNIKASGQLMPSGDLL